MNWTEALVFKLMNKYAFEGIQPSEKDKVIADKLIEREPELQSHVYDEVVAAVSLWKDDKFFQEQT